ncbi:hypothetical protein QHF83_42915, partial [Polyangium sp. 15x6]
ARRGHGRAERGRGPGRLDGERSRPSSRVEPRRPGEEHEHELAAVLAALAALAGVMVEPSEAEDQGASMGSARGRPRASSRAARGKSTSTSSRRSRRSPGSWSC